MTEAETVLRNRALVAEMIDRLSNADFRSSLLKPAGEVGSYFERGRHLIEGCLTTIDMVASITLDSLTPPAVSHLNTYLQRVYESLNQIATFGQERHKDPDTAANDILDHLEAHWHELFANATMYAAFAQSPTRQIEQLREEAKAALTERDTQLNERLRRIDEINKQSEEANERARMVQAESGIARQATFFQTEAKDYATQAKEWLNRTTWAAAIALLAAIAVRWIPLGTSSDPMPVKLQHALSNFVVVSLLAFIVIFCSKNYSASRHNEIANRHRYNALKTFEGFIDSANDQVTKDAVLLHVAQAIFAPSGSGYVKDEAEQAAPTAVVSLARDALTPKT